MIRFGDELRQEREKRGLAVEDVCAATKVSVHNVLALESGDLGQLPGGVFRRGIVRSYLAAVGLDQAVWMERFDVRCRELGLGAEGERDWVQFAENVKRSRSVERAGMGWRWFGVAVLLVGLGAMAWLAWHFIMHRKLALHEVAANHDPFRSVRYLAVEPGKLASGCVPLRLPMHDG